jgi:hypothetical protein
LSSPASSVIRAPGSAPGIDLPCRVRAWNTGGRASRAWRAATPGIDATRLVFPDGLEERLEMIQDASHPTDFPADSRGRSLCGRRPRGSQEQAKTHQHDPTPKRTHTDSFPRGDRKRAAIGRAVGLQAGMVPRIGEEIPGESEAA